MIRHLFSIFMLPLVLAVPVLLAGCAGDSLATANAQISSDKVQTGIQLACAGYQAGDSFWKTYSATNKVSDKVMKIAADTEAGIGALCTPPYPTDVGSVVGKVTAAGAAILQAIAEAKAENGDTRATTITIEATPAPEPALAPATTTVAPAS